MKKIILKIFLLTGLLFVCHDYFIKQDLIYDKSVVHHQVEHSAFHPLAIIEDHFDPLFSGSCNSEKIFKNYATQFTPKPLIPPPRLS